MDDKDTPDLLPALSSAGNTEATDSCNPVLPANAILQGAESKQEEQAASKTRREAAADPLAARNKRLFGALFVGTLKQAKSRLDSSEDRQRLEKQSNAQEGAARKDARAQEAAEEERRRRAAEVAEARAKEAAARRQAQAEREAAAAQERAEQAIRRRVEDVSTCFTTLAAHVQELGRVTYPGPSSTSSGAAHGQRGVEGGKGEGPRYTHGFLLTAASPPLYWSPYKANGESKRSGRGLGERASAQIQKVHDEMQERVDQVSREVEEEISERRAKAGQKRPRPLASPSTPSTPATASRGAVASASNQAHRDGALQGHTQGEGATSSRVSASEVAGAAVVQGGGQVGAEQVDESSGGLPAPPPTTTATATSAAAPVGEGEVMLDYE